MKRKQKPVTCEFIKLKKFGQAQPWAELTENETDFQEAK